MQARVGGEAVERLGALLLVGENASLGDLLEVDLLLGGDLVWHDGFELDKTLASATSCLLLLTLLFGFGGRGSCCRLRMLEMTKQQHKSNDE